jgi:hypothetical protein
VEKADRVDRLTAFVDQARRLVELARPQTAYTIRALSSLNSNEIAELGRWKLQNGRVDEIAGRLTEVLSDDRRTIRRVLSDCLMFDLWQDYEQSFEKLKHRYESSEYNDAAIEEILGRPPHTYSFLLHGGLGLWKPETENLGWLLHENDYLAAACSGFLVMKGRAFVSKLDLMEASVREAWDRWQELWRWW